MRQVSQAQVLLSSPRNSYMYVYLSLNLDTKKILFQNKTDNLQLKIANGYIENF